MPRWAARSAAGKAAEEAEALLEQAADDRKPHGGRWLLWLPMLVAGAVLYALNITNDVSYHGPRPGHLAPLPEVPLLRKGSGAFLVDTEGCRIPALDPFDPQVQRYVSEPPPLNCAAGRGRPLVASNMTALFLLPEALPDYNVSALADVSCCYQPFYRKENDDDSVRYAENCTAFDAAAPVEPGEEFVRVQCSADGAVVYEDFHAFVPRKAAVEERCANATPAPHAPAHDAPSVLLLGIDAVSRLNFHRQMPRTALLLKQLGAVEMLGYNKVADNTFPNLVPVLTGLSTEELRNVCWPRDNAPFDDCPFVWNEYRDAGYHTGFGEDAPWMGIFNYVKRGFRKPPTDYYPRPFLKHIEEKIGHKKPMNAKLCVGGRVTNEVLLQYVWKYARTFRDERSFALFWAASLSHDYLNYPRLGDAAFAGLLARLRDEGVLRRSALALMSDHGIRWGSIRETYQGRLEERLPFLFLVLPEWFRERYAAAVANAGRNARRLSTPFDLHETLRDLLRPGARLSQEAVRRRSRAVAEAPAGAEPRGVSLFLQLPRGRTCAQAGISPHWCTCQRSAPVDRADAIVNRTAEFLVYHINQILTSFRQCVQLRLAEIKDVQMQVPLEDLRGDIDDPGVHDYVLAVRTEPGNAVFEATVRHTPKTGNLAIDSYVSRINLYGSQSACVNNYQMKLYCYCSS